MPRIPHQVGKFVQRSFDHLVVKHRKKDYKASVPPRVNSTPAFVHAKDRIPLWNISSGDRVRVNAGDHKGKIGTVNYVDREKNRVYLQEPEFARAKRPPTSAKGKIFSDPDYRPDQLIYFPKPLHYSNLSLVLQRTPEIEAQMIKQQQEEGTSGPLPEAVARRLRPTKIQFDWRCRRWVWKRFAENVRLMGSSMEGSRAVELAPEDRTVGFIRRRLAPPKQLATRDTTKDAATEDTFVPYDLSATTKIPELQIRDIEFGNKYSRANKTRRWNERKAAERLLAEEAKKASRKPKRKPVILAPASQIAGFLEA